MKYDKIARDKLPEMSRQPLLKVAPIVRRFFYVFLDISGVLLGIFLIWLGIQMMRGIIFPKELGIIVLVLGICAFLIHIGHYYNLKLRQWIFGPGN